MEKRNIVFIGRSIDGYIADRNGGLDWLQSIPNPDNSDMGYKRFIKNIDAIIMGRTTFETVCDFDCDWPYTKPVFVLSSTLTVIPDGYQGRIELAHGSLTDILETIHDKGYYRLYIDGGKTIQSFLKDDLIDDMIITTIPIVLGGGFSLFAELDNTLTFRHIESKTYVGEIVQNHYRRLR